jgi:AcrB/AcrD/AcrF family
LFDQSKLVTSSIAGVLREGAIAAGLTGLMILLFLGSWRSTLIVLISIPLSILTSIVILYFMGHTLNTMTLGGMALAVGILVDDSTVTIENTHRLRSEGMTLAGATLHGSAGIAIPTMMSTLAISCVFTSVVFLEGRQNFCSRRLALRWCSPCWRPPLTPILICLLLKGEHHGEADGFGKWFGRLFALGGFALLAAGLLLGGWGNYSLKREVMATAKRAGPRSCSVSTDISKIVTQLQPTRCSRARGRC